MHPWNFTLRISERCHILYLGRLLKKLSWSDSQKKIRKMSFGHPSQYIPSRTSIWMILGYTTDYPWRYNPSRTSIGMIRGYTTDHPLFCGMGQGFVRIGQDFVRVGQHFVRMGQDFVRVGQDFVRWPSLVLPKTSKRCPIMVHGQNFVCRPSWVHHKDVIWDKDLKHNKRIQQFIAIEMLFFFSSWFLLLWVCVVLLQRNDTSEHICSKITAPALLDLQFFIQFSDWTYYK